MIDHNRDGFIDKDDLHDMLASLGKVLPKLFCLMLCSCIQYRYRFRYISYNRNVS
jgi:Ca2+-binding EF-hand superfamily protein